MEKVDEHQITEEEKQKAFDVIFTSSRSDVGGVGGTDEPAGNYSLTLQFHSVIMGFTALLFWFFFFLAARLSSPHLSCFQLRLVKRLREQKFWRRKERRTPTTDEVVQSEVRDMRVNAWRSGPHVGHTWATRRPHVGHTDNTGHMVQMGQ